MIREERRAGPPAEGSSGRAPRRRGNRPTLLAWALYDWANSAYATLIQTFVFAAYFTRQVAADATQGTALWGNAIAAAGLLVAVGARCSGRSPTKAAPAGRC